MFSVRCLIDHAKKTFVKEHFRTPWKPGGNYGGVSKSANCEIMKLEMSNILLDCFPDAASQSNFPE